MEAVQEAEKSGRPGLPSRDARQLCDSSTDVSQGTVPQPRWVGQTWAGKTLGLRMQHIDGTSPKRILLGVATPPPAPTGGWTHLNVREHDMLGMFSLSPLETSVNSHVKSGPHSFGGRHGLALGESTCERLSRPQHLPLPSPAETTLSLGRWAGDDFPRLGHCLYCTF